MVDTVHTLGGENGNEWTVEDVAIKADSEGLDYLILHWGLKPEQIVDAELSELWAQARDALAKIEEKLAPYTP